MAKDVVMPVLGMNQDTGLLVSWLKQEGDEVTKGEPIMEVETDKAVMEIDALESGILVGIRAKEGEDVPVGTVIAQIAQPGEAVAAPEAAPTSKAEASSTPPTPEAKAPTDAKPVQEQAPTEPLAAPAPIEGPRAPASPLARRLARDDGMDLARIAGSGPHGAVLARDVRRAGALAPRNGVATAPHVHGVATVLGELERRIDARHLTNLLGRNGGIPVAAAMTRFLASVVAKHLTDDAPSDVQLVVRGPNGSTSVGNAAHSSMHALADLLANHDDGDADPAPHAVLVHAGDAQLSALRPPPYAPVTLGMASARGAGDAIDLTLTLRYDVTSIGDAAAHAMMQDLALLVEEPVALSVHF